MSTFVDRVISGDLTDDDVEQTLTLLSGACSLAGALDSAQSAAILSLADGGQLVWPDVDRCEFGMSVIEMFRGVTMHLGGAHEVNIEDLSASFSLVAERLQGRRELLGLLTADEASHIMSLAFANIMSNVLMRVSVDPPGADDFHEPSFRTLIEAVLAFGTPPPGHTGDHDDLQRD